MTSYPYSDPSDRFADCRYPKEPEPVYTNTICPICGERIAADDSIVTVGHDVTYHRDCFESDLWELLEPLGVVLGTMPDEVMF